MEFVGEKTSLSISDKLPHSWEKDDSITNLIMYSRYTPHNSNKSIWIVPVQSVAIIQPGDQSINVLHLGRTQETHLILPSLSFFPESSPIERSEMSFDSDSALSFMQLSITYLLFF